MRKFKAILLLLVLLALLSGCGKENRDRPLGGICLTYADDSLMQETAQVFTEKLKANNYRTQVVYCDGSIVTQLRQIENFVAQGADLVVVNCAGNSDAYEEVFANARKQGCRIMVTGLASEIENCDIQAISTHIFKGMRMCELLKKYLDKEYPDAAPGSVKVLLMEKTTILNDIKACAGYRLVKERFLRYYDMEHLDFIREESGEQVYFLNGKDEPELVDEPAGGLILDENGYAQLNPFYDARVDLQYAANRDISTNLEGQAAIDAFMATAQGVQLRIVIAYSGEAAIGADERLMYYQDIGAIPAERCKLAVFGSGNTEINRTRTLSSVHGDSLLRGYVCAEPLDMKAETMLDLLFRGENKHFYMLDSSRSELTADGSNVGLVTVINSRWRDPEMFFLPSK